VPPRERSRRACARGAASASARVPLRSAALLAACSCAASGATRTPRVSFGRFAPCAQPSKACSRGAACALRDCAVISHGPVVLQAPQAGAPITVWVKRMDVAGVRYVAVKDVDGQQTVDDFIARWIAQAKLDVDPSLVTLRMVKCGSGNPTAKQEAKAKALDDPRLTLAGAGLTDGCSLLAFVAGVFAFTRSFSSLCPTVFFHRRYFRFNRVDASACSSFCGGFLEAAAQRNSGWQRVTSCWRNHLFGEQQAAWLHVHS